MRFSDLLHPPGDKVSLGEMAEIRNLLPERATSAVPHCIYTAEGRYDYEVFIILAWIMARRDLPDITREKVGNKIGLKEAGHFELIEKEIHYFYSRRTRDEINDHFKRVAEAAERRDDTEVDSSEEVSDQLEDQNSENPPTAPAEDQ